MSDRVQAEIVKWALWTSTGVTALIIATWPPGYPLRPWKWGEYERELEKACEAMRESFRKAMTV